MRLRDRRAAIAALVLCAAYVAFLLWPMLWVIAQFQPSFPRATSPAIDALLRVNFFLMSWRIFMRAVFAGHAYGWRYGVGAIPRTLLANLITILATQRALSLYARSLLGQPLSWDKTQHQFPDLSENR